MAALKAKGYGTSEEQFEYPVDYQVPKKAKLADNEASASSSAGVTASASEKSLPYPDTSGQYVQPPSDGAETQEESKPVGDAFAAAREQEESSEGGANWLRDAAWEPVREQVRVQLIGHARNNM